MGDYAYRDPNTGAAYDTPLRNAFGRIGGALMGRSDPGTSNKKIYDSRPFPKQNNPQLNDEAAEQAKKGGN